MNNTFNYNLHTKYLTEQSATLSDNPKQRIKDYLDSSPDLLGEIKSKVSNLKNGVAAQLKVENNKFGILDTDMIMIEADLSDKAKPKYKIWVTNDKIMFEGIDIDVAASRLWNAAKGAGTDETAFISVGAAVHKIASDKGIDASLIFDKIDKKLTDRHGESLTKLIDGEFSGQAEVICLNMFRREIEKSVARGIYTNLGNIMFDIGLTVATMGAGTLAAKVGLKGADVAHKASTAGRGALKLKQALDSSKLYRRVANGLSSTKAGGLFKTSIGVNKPFKYISSTNQMSTATVLKYRQGKTGLKAFIEGTVSQTGTKWGPVWIDAANVVKKTGLVGGLAASSAITIPGAFAAKKAGEIAQNLNMPTSQSDGFNLAEIMGWYDTLSSDPTKYIENTRAQGAKSIAQNLYELKSGSGLFGNTTDQEELAIGLLITSITPATAISTAQEYSKLDDASSAYAVISDELGGDLAIATKMYWTAVTGTGSDYSSNIQNAYNAISKK